MKVCVDLQNGISVPEGEIYETVNMLVQQLRLGLPTPAIAQQELILGLRLHVKVGKLSSLVFEFKDKLYPVNPQGLVLGVPEEFPGAVLQFYLNQLLDK